MQKVLIIGALIAAFFATTAQAGSDARLCRSPNAQSGSGQTFQSRQECARASEVFAPTLTSSPSSFGAGERYTLTAQGLHANAYTVIYFAISGQAPYGSYTPFYPTDASGNFSIPFVFAECARMDTGEQVSVALTLTIVDSFGVHASTGVVLC